MFRVIQARAWVMKEIKRVQNLEESLLRFFPATPTRCLDLVGSVASLHVQACNHDEWLFEIDVCYVRRPWVDGTHSVSRPHTYAPRRRTVLWSFRSRTSLSLSLSFSLAHVTSWWTHNQKKRGGTLHTYKHTLSGEDIVNVESWGYLSLHQSLTRKN